MVGGIFGLVLGWTGALVYLVPLVPIGVVLLVIDWRTTLLPTRIIHPTYVLLAVLVPLAALLDRDLDSLYRAGIGWLVIGGGSGSSGGCSTPGVSATYGWPGSSGPHSATSGGRTC